MSACPCDRETAHCRNAREVLRLSELYLDGTVRYALAADARAGALSATMASLMGAAAVVGAALVALANGPLSPLVLFLTSASVTASLCFLMALRSAAAASQPGEFDVPGNLSRNFLPGDLDGCHADLLLAQAAIYDQQIDQNAERLRASARHLRSALAWAAYAPVVAVLAGVAAVAVGFPAR